MEINKKKIQDKSFFFVWMACLIFSLFFIAYFFFLRTSEIDVTKHLSLRYSGENGSASVKVTSEEVSVNQRLQDFYDSLRFTITPNENLKNGDQLTISVEYDRDLAQQYHLEPVNLVRVVTVEGLPDRYENASAIPQPLLDSLSKHADSYLEKHLNSILDNDFTDFYSMEDVTLKSSELIYEAFMKSKSEENSDRLVAVYELSAEGSVNSSDEQKQLKKQSSTIYYMVVFPSINDSGVIMDANAYGEKLLLSVDSKDTQDEVADKLNAHLAKKGGNGYRVEEVNRGNLSSSSEQPTSEEKTK